MLAAPARSEWGTQCDPNEWKVTPDYCDHLMGNKECVEDKNGWWHCPKIKNPPLEPRMLLPKPKPIPVEPTKPATTPIVFDWPYHKPILIRPDPKSTDGDVRPDGHDLKMCGQGKKYRGPMNPDRRDEVLIRYGLPPGTHPDYEIDHLIPLCLGGSDDFTNLWPQPRRGIEAVWNAEKKDRLEHRLCQMVCAGQVDLSTAQQEIAEDWIAAYQKYFKRSCPVNSTTSDKGVKTCIRECED